MNISLSIDAVRISLDECCAPGRVAMLPDGVSYGNIAGLSNELAMRFGLAAASSGVFVYVPSGVNVTKPLVVFGAVRTAVNRLYILLDRQSTVQIMSVTDSDADVAIERRVVLMEGASMHECELFLGDAGVVLDSTTECSIAGDASLESVTVIAGGADTNFRRNIRLEGARAECRQWGLFLLSDKQHSRLDVNMHHLSGNCTSDQLFKGIAGGSASGLFTGRVTVAVDAQNTQAMQQSRNIVLSPTASIGTRPELEIYADQVKCSHGATVGQLDSDAIYYMMQRGLSLKEAQRLQIEGFTNDIVEHVSCADLAQQITDVVADKMLLM